MSQEQEQEKRMILSFYEQSDGRYAFDIKQGTSIAEVIYGMAIIIKCFQRDGIVEDTKSLEDLLHKYLTDSQYEEVKPKDGTAD